MTNVQRICRRLGMTRTTLYAVGLPLMIFTLAAMGNWQGWESVKRYALVIAGFSFVIFVHELGHFIVARWCSVKCEVFSIGIGWRMLGWKKGVGLTFGPEKAPEKKDTPAVTPVGDCDYRISWLPLGGYVRMLGQDDMDPTKVSTDPHAFNNRPIWQRMCIVSAGVTMNVIVAFIIFAIVFYPSVGVKFEPAVIGRVAYQSPAEKAGLQLGDRIIAIEGKHSTPSYAFVEFTDLMISSALADKGQQITYTYLRGDDPTERKAIATPTMSSRYGFQVIGVEPYSSLNLGTFTPAHLENVIKKHPEVKELRSDDRIVRAAIHGQTPAPLKGYQELNRIVSQSYGQPVDLVLVNATDTKIPERTVQLSTDLMYREGTEPLKSPINFLGLYPHVMIDGVVAGKPAELAGLKKGDIILRINTVTHPKQGEINEIIGRSLGSNLAIEVMRPEQGIKTFQVTPLEIKGDDGKLKGFIGVEMVMAMKDPSIAGANANADLSNIPPGSKIISINGTAFQNWHQLRQLLESTTETAELKLQDPSGAEKIVNIAITKEMRDEMNKMVYALGIELETHQEIQKAQNVTDTLIMGVDHTKKFILQTYLTLHGLFNRTISPTQLHGIVGITKIGHDAQSRGLIFLLFMMGVVSVNLAVANFLPLPIVDGGLFLLLILEKLRGKPLSLKVQSMIQIVGLCLLAGLFIFVTYNDIGLFFVK